MTDHNIELTRRKILASMGAVGAAGAGAGMGTTALFNDEESFENNSITAGELDLKMDWEEHYSYPQIYDGFGDPTVEDGTELDVVRDDPDDSRYVGLPDPNNPVVWANDEDEPLDDGRSSLELYFQNTTIEAYPDRADGEVEATFTSIDSGGNPVVENPCDALADVPQDLSTYASEGTPARTKNADTYDAVTDAAHPLINLRDVKPGDFGELTFSAHLCDNDGYLWLQMPGGLTESENDIIEPEGEVDETPEAGELAANVETALWYDEDCNNRIEPEPDDVVALAVIDTSSSTESNLGDIIDAANALVEDLYDATQENPGLDVWAGIVTFEGTGDTNNPMLANPIVPVDTYVDSGGNGQFDGATYLPAESLGGSSPIPHALDVSREYLNDKAGALDADSGNDVEDPNKELLLVSDGDVSIDTSGLEGFGELINPDGTPFSFDGNTYESDYFDGEANGSDLKLPNPDSPPNDTATAEAVLVARDIDGEPFVPGSAYSQPAGPKVDNPDGQPTGYTKSDPADLSGDNGITVRAAAVYPAGAVPTTKDLARDSMMAIASGDGAYYDVPTAGGADSGRAVASDILGGGTGEDVIFRGTLPALAGELSDGLLLEGNQGGGCYTAGATHCFGFAWWVPEDVGNEIQSDSVGFDLGFYTEQCRNNPDPTGPATE
ncbi:SipW-dependent-type signal peptide-containing protein [Halobaculum gomorrense]|uniref:SipW-cognate class signal peptide n=1 Tax=Halobaculum gomorrense TaxID=43928 RepID=A0A1M5UF87_9EURY|nr:SipW-dependent-type signal peptide-containing protein [Halobaculum gomorrense]SHH61617.1 SipW-cognate class signal peptide [Halobaculum gomorrense]